MPRHRMSPSTYWQPCTYEHRCSRPWCYAPAVLVGERTVQRWEPPRTKYVTRRFLCRTHADDYSLVERRGRWWHRHAVTYPLDVLMRVRRAREERSHADTR